MASIAPPLLKSLRFNPFRTTRMLPLLSSSAKYQNGERRAITWNRMCNCHFSSAVEPSEFEDVELHDDIKATEKQNALHLAVSQLASDFDGDDMLFLHRFFCARRKPVISTGSLKLDLALGIGGLPKGRIVELYGYEASGKTTLALHIIKEAQKLGGHCAYLDVENALDPSLVESIGVNTDDLLISQPDSAENILSIVNTLAKSGSVDVIVVDSVAALVPQREIDTVIGDEYADMQSQIMTKALRKIHHSLCRSETLIIFVNQVRANLRSGQGYRQGSEVTCGGNALPFYSAIRMRISRKGLLKTGDKVTGLGICIEVVKNKLAPAMKKAELEIEFGRGICSASEVLKLACEHGVVPQDGGSYFIDGAVINSQEAAKEYLIQNGTVLDKLVDTLRRQLFENDS